ncbi:hypothetical protein VB715_05980 [Crocosphaera sp. UHCC 0190]|uniref:hypothetical protein n=1 Tax=Crocosphaera sp. UHCC 0190 TaxID=3110246 RepID=UPI002B2160F5|nr:hypothetical protein [Crocosphaera sp. UHCC 0190]MEA5509310.1 hypothetical protein [Crocosphaera sp. UHCC 0190]
MKKEQYTTRIQLKGYGASQYQSRLITKKLTPIDIEKRTYIYDLSDVITSIKQYLERPKIQSQTRRKLESILKVLLERLGNVVTVPFIRGNDPQLSQVSKQLFDKIADVDRYFSELNANIATIKGKYTP